MQIWRRWWSWKSSSCLNSIFLFAVFAYGLRYALIVSYCYLCHLLIYRRTTCAVNDNPDLRPRSFLDDPANIWPPKLIINSGSSSSPPLSCRGHETILIYVPCKYDQYERRSTIRQTWANQILAADRNGDGADAKLIFVLGSPAPTSPIESIVEDVYRLRAESASYNDTIRFDLIDHYYNLTLKTRAVFDWTIRNCPNIQFLIRVDADIVLRVDNLYRFLDHYHRLRSSSSLIGVDDDDRRRDHRVDRPIVFGRCRRYDCVTRIPWSKSCLPWTFYFNYGRPLFYPSYCLGFSSIASIGYVRRAIDRWNHNHERSSIRDYSPSSYLPMEDLHVTGYTGLEIGAWKINHPTLFNYDRYFDTFPCGTTSSVLASAAYDDEQVMRRRWKDFQEKCDS